MIKIAKKFLLSPFSFFVTRGKSIASLSKRLSSVTRDEYDHAIKNDGFAAALVAKPAGRRAPAHVISKFRAIAIALQVIALVAVSFTLHWAIVSDARLIEIANFIVFSAAATIGAFVSAFVVGVAKGKKTSLLQFLTDPAGLIAEPWVATDAA